VQDPIIRGTAVMHFATLTSRERMTCASGRASGPLLRTREIWRLRSCWVVGCHGCVEVVGCMAALQPTMLPHHLPASAGVPNQPASHPNQQAARPPPTCIMDVCRMNDLNRVPLPIELLPAWPWALTSGGQRANSGRCMLLQRAVVVMGVVVWEGDRKGWKRRGDLCEKDVRQQCSKATRS